MTYEEALQYIHSVSWKGSRPGLSRITELMRLLGNPEKRLRYLHVVGTNGKGSTCAMLASILTEAGYQTGLYTSPYLVDFRERMQINGQMIPQQELADITERVRLFIDQMADSPTEFERITAIALCWFAERGCDIVVLEAGMGGEFDATNVIPAPELAIFTNIGLDHTEYLGDTVEKIAATKAGILKPGCMAVLYPNVSSVNNVIAAACEKQKVPLSIADFSMIRSKTADLTGQLFDYPPYSDLFLPLLGEHQLKNAAVALTAIEALRSRRGDSRIARPVIANQSADWCGNPFSPSENRGVFPSSGASRHLPPEGKAFRSIRESTLRDAAESKLWHISEDAVRDGLASVTWPGRFEVLRRDPLLILDGAHNDQCVDALCRALETYLKDTPLSVVTGVLADKDYPRMYRRLDPFAAEYFSLTPDNPRALSADVLAAHLSRYGKPVTVCKSILDALSQAKAEGRPILCCGSLYLIGEIKAALS